MGSISDVHINSSINLWNGNLQQSIQLPVNAPLFVHITILSALLRLCFQMFDFVMKGTRH